jgi:hypothetical protein
VDVEYSQSNCNKQSPTHHCDSNNYCSCAAACCRAKCCYIHGPNFASYAQNDKASLFQDSLHCDAHCPESNPKHQCIDAHCPEDVVHLYISYYASILYTPLDQLEQIYHLIDKFGEINRDALLLDELVIPLEICVDGKFQYLVMYNWEISLNYIMRTLVFRKMSHKILSVTIL